MRASSVSLLALAALLGVACEEHPDGSEPSDTPGSVDTSPPPDERLAPTTSTSPPVAAPMGFIGGTVTPPSSPLGGLLGGGFGGFSGGGIEQPQPVRLSELRTAAKTPPPISGGTLAVDRAGSVAVVADSDRDMVYVVDLVTGGVRKVKLASGSEPGRVALDGNKSAHVALRGSGKLARIDLASAALVETPVCAHPRGVALDGPRARVIVSCLDGQLVQLDAATHSELARKSDLPSDLRDVIIGPNGVEAVTRYRSAELVRLNAEQGVQSMTRPRNGSRFDFSKAGGILLPEVVPPPPDSATFPQPPAQPQMIALTPTLAWRTISSGNGRVLMLHQQSQEAEVATTQAGGYGSGGCATITSGKVSELDAQGNTVRTMGVQLFGLSVDTALSANGKWLAVASPGAYTRGQGTLQVYTTTSMQEVEQTGACQSPSHMSGEENQTTAVAFDDNNVLYSFSRDPAELQIFGEPQFATSPSSSSTLAPALLGMPRLTRKATIALDLGSARDTGHDLFHADVGQGLACASCHGEALDDAHVWTFEKIGPRRTQNMRGGLLGTAPFHWDGDMMSINHLVDEVMTRRMGGFKVMGPFATALGAWIDRQPALTLPVRDAAAVERGKTLFNAASTQCSTCHSGKNFTNNESRDVGTGKSFQVPSLLGLALRAPYMHSGCAKTLDDRFKTDCGGGDKHGRTSDLTLAQVADLIAYMKSL